jgi:hypothetical protein
MNFALLWVEALAIGLFWVGMGSALGGRVKGRGWRVLLAVVVVGVPTFVLGSFVFGAAATKLLTAFQPSWFGYAVSLLVCFWIGAGVIVGRGRRGAGEGAGDLRCSAGWGRGGLLFGFGISVVLGYLTLQSMDFEIRTRCSLQRAEVNSLYLASLPAIVSESQNAARLYEQAFAELRDRQDQETLIKNYPTGNSLAFDPSEPATISYLKNVEGTLTLLRRAAALPGCRFDEDMVDPAMDEQLFSLNEERNAANVLSLDAREDLARGRVVEAIGDANAILHMSRHFGLRPMLISGMVGVGIADIGNKTLEQALPLVKKVDELAPLELGDLLPVREVYRESLRGEERFGLDLFSKMPDEEMQLVNHQIKNPEAFPSSGRGLLGAFSRVFYLNSDGYISLMTNLQECSKEPYFQARSQLRQAFLRSQSDGLLASMIGPSLDRFVGVVGVSDGEESCMRMGVAATRFRLKHGKLPGGLEDLVPEFMDSVPAGPFDGKPLKIAVKKDRWVIYCLGSDLVDHGGVETENFKRGDVTFTLR